MASEELMRKSIMSYIAAWNEHDAEKRVRLIDESCSEDVRIVTGGREISGRVALDGAIADYHRRRSGDVARLSSRVEIKGQIFRFTGVVEGSKVAEPVHQFDAGECDDDGRIRLILTFAGAAPPPL